MNFKTAARPPHHALPCLARGKQPPSPLFELRADRFPLCRNPFSSIIPTDLRQFPPPASRDQVTRRITSDDNSVIVRSVLMSRKLVRTPRTISAAIKVKPFAAPTDARGPNCFFARILHHMDPIEPKLKHPLRKAAARTVEAVVAAIGQLRKLHPPGNVPTTSADAGYKHTV